MNRVLSPVTCVVGSLLLLCSCSKPQPDGAYRVEVTKVSSQPRSITRKYAIETTSLRKLVLADCGGSASHSIAPDTMTEEGTGKAEATVSVELTEAGDKAQVIVKMTVETPGATAKCEETLAAPGAVNLTTILTETSPIGELTTETTLLRVASGDKYLDVFIE